MEEELAALAIDQSKPITPELESLLKKIATDGKLLYKWGQVQILLVITMVNLLNKSNELAPDCPNIDGESFSDQKHRLVEALKSFDKAPFTLQRLCEILTIHSKIYKSTRKLIFAIEKLLCVSSTIPSFEPSGPPSSSGGGSMGMGFIVDTDSVATSAPWASANAFSVKSAPGSARTSKEFER